MIVHIVDDDPAVRESLAVLLGILGHRTALYADAEALLAVVREDWTGCVVSDLRLPGRSGIELQAELRRLGIRMPVIIVTAHGDVAGARAAFHGDAVDFLEKPFDRTQITAAIARAMERERDRVADHSAREARRGRLGELTVREHEVLAHVADGLHAREIGEALGISARTVEVHKSRIMSKLGARNVAELVRIAIEGEIAGRRGK